MSMGANIGEAAARSERRYWQRRAEAAEEALERQAAQLAALRAGASTEDLHAAPAGQDERIAALEAEADVLHAAADGWRKRAEAAEETLELVGEAFWQGKDAPKILDEFVVMARRVIGNSKGPDWWKGYRYQGELAPEGYYEELAAAAAEARSEIRRQALEEAAAWVDQRLADYVADHGVYDPETGVTEFPGNGEEYCGELEEIAAAIRALADKPAAGS